MLGNSFMSINEIISRYSDKIIPTNFFDFSVNDLHYVNISFIPDKISIEQYITIFFESPFYLRSYCNTILIIAPVLIGQFIVSPIAAYGFQYITCRKKELIFSVYILIILMPIQVLLVPQKIIVNFFNMDDSYWAIILPGIFNPISVFLIRQHLKNFPYECKEAAYIDGASEIKVFLHVVYPNMKTILFALFMLNFSEYWNLIDQAIVFIKSLYKMPLSLYLADIIQNNMGMLFAASSFFALPPVLVFLSGEDHLVNGISLSGIR
jgi:multiple sugar transport system permease protein